MASRLATWVWIGAAALACVAGMVNVVGYLGFEHQAITHLTGTTSLLGAALAQGNLRAGLQLAGMLLAFVLGAVLSGLLIKDSVLQLGRRYGVALSFEAALLVLAVPLFEQGYFAGPLLAAVAIGLQNAMATTYSGAIIRTSHVSGMFTDLGISIGHALRGLPVDHRRLSLCLVIISAFLAGGVMGAVLYGHWQYQALYLPAVLTGTTGLIYGVYRHRQIARTTP
ncbi:MAG TPA: YoaK family protein [Arenimonas sp.]|nr:YoaK family protein [Arenimonas sp.]